MQITLFQNPTGLYKTQRGNTQNKCAITPLAYDTVSFKALKKTALSNMEIACANMLKAPLEKFNSPEDFKKWAIEEFKRIYDLSRYKGVNEDVTKEREDILKEWKKYLQSDENDYKNSPEVALIAFPSITRDLKSTSLNLPNSLNKDILKKTINQIEENITNNKKYQFDFNKLYLNNLRIHYMQATKDVHLSPDLKIEGWVRIPSYENDSSNFRKNVEKLKALSYKSWCTKSRSASKYLDDGDFYIYYKNNQPKLGVRFKKGQIEEIQGQANNNKIPLDYLEVVENFVSGNISPEVEDKILKAKILKPKVAKIKAKIGESLKNKDYKAILEYIGIKTKTLEDNTLQISEYRQPTETVMFEDLGINEDEILKSISHIKGDGDFSNSRATIFKNLKSIDGRAIFANCSAKTLGSIESIGGDLNLHNSDMEDLGQLMHVGGSVTFNTNISKYGLKSLGNLEYVGGNANFKNCNFRDLAKLKHIGGDIYFYQSEIKTLNNLEYIGGDAHFENSQVNDIGLLKLINGSANFNNSRIENLKNLEAIGGNVNFFNSYVEDLGNLRKIGGNADFRYSSIIHLKNLKTISGDVDFRNSLIKDLGNLKEIGGNVYIKYFDAETFRGVNINGNIKGKTN